MNRQAGVRSLRAHLRHGTKAIHDRLDESVDPARLADPALYGEFLARQWRARQPIETWARLHCPPDLTPPPMADMIAADLAELGPGAAALPEEDEPFALPAGADPLGLAWTLAGSQMGNRAIHARLRKTGAEMPARFLTDARTTDFWQAILPRLKMQTDETGAEPALVAARAVFARFERAFALGGSQLAA